MVKNKLSTRLAEIICANRGVPWCGGVFCVAAVTLNYLSLIASSGQQAALDNLEESACCLLSNPSTSSYFSGSSGPKVGLQELVPIVTTL